MTGADPLIQEFVHGRYVDRTTGKTVPCSLQKVVTTESTAGQEAELLSGLGLGERLGIVADENTWEVAGRRIQAALPNSEAILLEHPKADEKNAAILKDKSRHVDGLVAVGSGTINDLCKHVTFADGRGCAVFGTAPSMNGYVTSTASITRDGYKLSLKSHAPRGVFYDLSVLAAAPVRMIRAGFGDAVCRSSAQVDWLLSHRLLGTVYEQGPFDIQAPYEPILLERAEGLVKGDLVAMRALTDMLTLGGFGVLFTHTSHSGSMAEHSISHYIDMFADPHPGTLHGEQVGVATLTASRLQARILALETLPPLQVRQIDDEKIRRLHGKSGDEMVKVAHAKALDAEQTRAMNERLERSWPELRSELLAIMLPLEKLVAAYAASGTATTAAGIGIAPCFYRRAVLNARDVRDRWSFLDLAGDLDFLEGFAEHEG
ncbi:iron-containing alcohol dehydrogenase [Geminicoccus roseus]|uniref:iron-containing alcohol dehydrogenase n=1 Tax=Geminicoccus roseus TaxID=404900 RepID=UPI00041A4882|nr:iron-containing alcohol dehydrogenase [Geminicoccus roseus]